MLVLQALRGVGRVLLAVLQVFSAAGNALGSGGTVGATPPPAAPTKKPNEYRP